MNDEIVQLHNIFYSSSHSSYGEQPKRLRFCVVTKYHLVPLLIIALTAGAVIWLSRSSKPRQAAIRNVVLISIDTCRADHLSCYGHSLPTTPNIDAIAHEGVMFTRAQSTNPITLPAHCSLLTGTDPTCHGVHLNQNHGLADSHTTLAEILHDHGYQTGAFIGAFPLHSRFGLDQGFDTYDEQFGGQAGEFFFNERVAQQVVNGSISWLEQQRDKPFFLFIHTFDPHAPYAPPEPFASRFREDQYAGEIAYTDFCIGQVIAKLKQLDLFDSTLIIITADHGESRGEHDEATHLFFIYQSTVRVPLIIKAPGCAAGRKVDDAVGLIDIVPTVLHLLGLSVPPQVQGVDLGGYLGDRVEPLEDRYLYSETLDPARFDCCPLRGLVHGKWHYIWSVKPELYDLNRDPGEKHNLVEDEPEKAKLLQSRLQELLADQHRKAGERRSFVPDQETVRRLQSLGYVGGPHVDADMEIDMNTEDPKDFIDLYNQYMRAASYAQQKRFDEARAECLDILTQRPHLLPVKLLLGPIAEDQGRLAGALDAVTRLSNVLADLANAKNPQVFAFEVNQAHKDRGNAYLALGNYEFAIKDYAHVIQFWPNDAETYNSRGNAHMHLGNYRQAWDDYNRVIELEPDYAEAFVNRGNTQVHLGDYEQCLKDYRRAIELKPDYPEAYTHRANAHRHLGNYLLALEDYQRAIELKPDFAEAFTDRGNTHKQLGHYQQAMEDYNRVVELKPDFAEAYTQRGNAHNRSGNYQQAWEDYNRAIELKPDYVEAYTHRGNAQKRLGNYQQALEDYNRAIELKPDFDEAYTNRGVTYQDLGNFQLALNDFVKAIELKPDLVEVYNNLAWLLATCHDSNFRDAERAVSSAKRACELASRDDYSLLDTLAAAYAESGDFAEAVRWQASAVKMAPATNKAALESRLELYKAEKPYRQEPRK